jgi:hypothetical protein
MEVDFIVYKILKWFSLRSLIYISFLFSIFSLLCVSDLFAFPKLRALIGKYNEDNYAY